jgi:hypothetical protein
MSTKFEQLLDYLVNEEMDRANELFHEIVVEKSREIYENLISEEEDEESDMEEGVEDEESDMEEGVEDDTDDMEEGVEEEADESVELEDSYMMDADGKTGDDTDDFGGEISDTGDNFDAPAAGMDGEEGGEEDEESAIFSIKNAIAELEAAFADLEAAKGGDMGSSDMGGSDMGGSDMGGKFGDEKDDAKEDDMMGLREYRETVSGGHGAEKKGAAEGGIAGANTGEKMPGAGATKSPISSGSGKPTSNARPISSKDGSVGANTGTSPSKHMKGINPESGEKFAKGIHNVDGAKSGVKTLSKVTDGHGAEKRGGGEGRAVGAGTGENSVKGATHTTSLLKKL